MSEGPHPIATSSQTVGPFFHFGLTVNENLGLVASPDTPGEHIQLRVRVLDGAGEAVPDAVVEIYQADAEGRYPDSTESRLPAVARSAEVGAPSLQPSAPGLFSGFGRLPTGADGWCQFRTIRPGPVRTNGIRQASHVNVCLLARGLLRQIYTRIYFKGDAGLATDPLLTLVPEERRATLLAEPSAGEPATWDFVIRMQGSEETVFFDL
jgi:protocatechuate 3,4-dioxygenase alpha subunit